jgi:hypothetical protein
MTKPIKRQLSSNDGRVALDVKRYDRQVMNVFDPAGRLVLRRPTRVSVDAGRVALEQIRVEVVRPESADARKSQA